jgi:WhiB family redox-sensing transcriptional regulator
MIGSWTNQARCAGDEPGVDPKDFQVPLRGNSQNKAKLVCAECPVQMECLQWALEHQEIWSVWGGLDEAEIRRALSVDSYGRYVRRCRPPGCPSPRCRARPSALEIIAGNRIPMIRCTVCGFAWRSQTSAAALKTYRRERLQVERRRLRLKARLIVVQAVREPGCATPRPIPPVVTQESVPTSLVASAGN